MILLLHPRSIGLILPFLTNFKNWWAINDGHNEVLCLNQDKIGTPKGTEIEKDVEKVTIIYIRKWCPFSKMYYYVITCLCRVV